MEEAQKPLEIMEEVEEGETSAVGPSSSQPQADKFFTSGFKVPFEVRLSEIAYIYFKRPQGYPEICLNLMRQAILMAAKMLTERKDVLPPILEWEPLDENCSEYKWAEEFMLNTDHALEDFWSVLKNSPEAIDAMVEEGHAMLAKKYNAKKDNANVLFDKSF